MDKMHPKVGLEQVPPKVGRELMPPKNDQERMPPITTSPTVCANPIKVIMIFPIGPWEEYIPWGQVFPGKNAQKNPRKTNGKESLSTKYLEKQVPFNRKLHNPQNFTRQKPSIRSQACRPWGCQGCDGNPKFWPII